MTKLKKDNTPVLYIVLGLIFLVLYIGKVQFEGALVTTCENIEPSSLAEYIDVMDEINATVDSSEPYTIMNETSLIQLQTYTITSAELGVFELILPTDTTCSELLAIVDTQVDGTVYVTLSQRQVLLTDEGYMWCNHDNNVALRSTSVTTFAAYYDKFEPCITQDVSDVTQAVVTDEATCDALDGVWVHGQCLCGDIVMKVSDPVCTYVAESDSDSEPRETITTEPVQTTTGTVISEPPKAETFLDKLKESKIQLAVLVGLALFLAYWFLEKGPSKGLIKGRKRK